MDFLQSILHNTQYASITAIVLGLMTAISPCPLATNITAIGFISKDIADKRRVFVSGIVYTFGRAFSYTLLAVILFLGASKINISRIFQGWGDILIGPVLLIIGLFMLGIFRFSIPGFGNVTEKIGERLQGSYWGAFILGVLFALAFCPYSGVLYFSMLIPITIASVNGLYLPLLFAIATGIPVIIFAWVLAYTISNVGVLYNNVKRFELWFRRVVAIVFICVGLLYIYKYFFYV
ncbi:MAG TPA: aromatic aminobenezylarsenical efflux permease ArsG family transporter [Bacteroidales bacterium]|jgi:thiol:disulfide interchange protein|nr:aromatic aminobenezylarsenical efflux permease ArsG family transporter [Bacteroidales bacterium]HRS19979.1 aromatic aminobenezylarsenical efflux permease ArsG family transporter [Bacteroidales bacterium]